MNYIDCFYINSLREEKNNENMVDESLCNINVS